MKYMKTFANISFISLVVATGINTSVSAEHTVTYSPEQWPTRWSSTMRKQQDNRYPERRAEHISSDEHDRTMSEDDLFLYSPDTRFRYEDRYERPRSRDRRSRYEDRESRFNERRNAMQRDRERHWSTAYGGYPGAYPYAGNMPYTPGPYPYGYGLYGVDPLLGYPPLGLGYPSMFGPGFGYPLLGYPGIGGWGAPHLW